MNTPTYDEMRDALHASFPTANFLLVVFDPSFQQATVTGMLDPSTRPQRAEILELASRLLHKNAKAETRKKNLLILPGGRHHES